MLNICHHRPRTTRQLVYRSKLLACLQQSRRFPQPAVRYSTWLAGGVRTRSTKAEHLALGFAFGQSDRTRLNHLQAMNRDVAVIAVNDGSNELERPSTAFYGFRSGNFSTRRGLNRPVTEHTIMVYFDYFWLQPGWYGQRYGIRWCSPGGSIEFFLKERNVQQAILPVDKVGEMQTQVECNRSFLRSFCTIEYLSKEQAAGGGHPLLTSDQEIDEEIPRDRVSCTYQLNTYTTQGRPFVSFKPLR